MKHILVGILVGIMLSFTGVAVAALGPELISDGTFTAGGVGWSFNPIAGWPGAAENSIIDVGGTHGKVLETKWDDVNKKRYAGSQTVTVIPGATYTLQYDKNMLSAPNGMGHIGIYAVTDANINVISASGGGGIWVRTGMEYLGSPWGALLFMFDTGGWATHTVVFQALGSNVSIALYDSYGATIQIDNVSLKKHVAAPTASLLGGIGVAGSTVTGIGADADGGIISAVIKDSSGVVIAGGTVSPKTGSVNVSMTITPGMDGIYTFTVTDEDGLSTSAMALVKDIYADIINAIEDVLSDLPPGLLKIDRNGDGN